MRLKNLVWIILPAFIYIFIYSFSLSFNIKDDYPAPPPPAVEYIPTNVPLTLEDNFISFIFYEMEEKTLLMDKVNNKLTQGTIKFSNLIPSSSSLFSTNYSPLFTLKMDDKSYISSSDCRMSNLQKSSTYISASFHCRYNEATIEIHWKAKLSSNNNNFKNNNNINKDNNNNNNNNNIKYGSSYVRQFITIETNSEVSILEIIFIQSISPDSRVYGEVDGSPIVDNKNYIFFGIEHPMASNLVKDEHIVSCSLKAVPPLLPGHPQKYSASMGSYPNKERLYTTFVNYLEKERASPYRQFLHYNSWYDLNANLDGKHKMNEKQCLDRIEVIGRELVERRNVSVESFLIDDGWDDHHSLWDFNSKFPNEFSKLNQLAQKYGFGLGVWLSPWGGYNEARENRLQYGKQNNLEINSHGFSLSGPKYFQRFLSKVENMLVKQNVNLFKFDGIGMGWNAYGAAEYASDISAMLDIVTRLRSIKKDIFINLTIGTWASPYWLFFADSIWRGEEDIYKAGEGVPRRQWITYRDFIVYKNIVKRGPLYPISNLMLHGIICAKVGIAPRYNLDKVSNFGIDDDMSYDSLPKGALSEFKEEVWSFFASGINLQELYISPEAMTKQGWDIIAEAANWARDNSDILKFSHWVGGNPDSPDIYGFSSSNDNKGILFLRNPDKTSQSISLSLSQCFPLLSLAKQSLPSTDTPTYKWRTVYCGECGSNDDVIMNEMPTGSLQTQTTLNFGPFQVVLLEVIINTA